MRVVLSGYYGFNNVGDEAILFSIIRSLRELQPDITITVLSNDAQSTKDTYDVEAVNRWSLKEVSNVLKEADGLISGGGSLLQDETGLKSIPYYTGIMRIAKWHQTPVFVYAQGMGPIHRRLSKWLTKTALNKVDTVTVRDEESKTLLQEIGVQKSISVVPDPVLSLDATSFTSEWLEKQKLSGPVISVSVRDWPSEEPFKENIAACLDTLVQNGYAVVFVPMHGQIDEITSKETANLMNEHSLVAPGNCSIEEKISMIGASSLLIGMRLHSLIFAALTYTPFVALSYDPKIDAFAAIFDQSIAGHVNNRDWDGASLFANADKILSNDKVRIDIEKKARQLQEEARKTPAFALDLFVK